MFGSGGIALVTGVHHLSALLLAAVLYFLLSLPAIRFAKYGTPLPIRIYAGRDAGDLRTELQLISDEVC